MDPNSRYIVSQSRIAERHAEADRARLLKGDRFDETITQARGNTVRGRTGTNPGLLGRLIGLRPRVGGRPVAPSAAPAG
jgi:hypothetical protein